MVTRPITIEWKGSVEQPSRVDYYVNGVLMGMGDEGFDKVLDFVRQHKGADVVVKVGAIPSDGRDFEGVLPFKHRLRALDEAAAPRHVAYEVF